MGGVEGGSKGGGSKGGGREGEIAIDGRRIDLRKPEKKN